MASLPAEKKAELDFRLKFKKIDAVVSTTKTVIQYSALVICVFWAYRSIEALAGKTTLASIGLSILGNFTISEGILVFLTGGSIIYGLGERELRRRNIRRLTLRSRELEERLDPKRTSSGLTSRGTTRPEDKK